MKEKDLILKALEKEMPDLEKVKANCLLGAKKSKHPFSIWGRTALAACCLIAVFSLRYFPLHSMKNNEMAPDNNYQLAFGTAGEADCVSNSCAASIEKKYANEETQGLTMNTLSALPEKEETADDFAGEQDFVAVSAEEWTDYYGFSLDSIALPENFTLAENQNFGFLENNGEIYCDINTVFFTGDGQEVILVASRDTDISDGLEENLLPSQIEGYSVTLGEYENGTIYMASFALGETRICLFTEKMSESDFLYVVENTLIQAGNGK